VVADGPPSSLLQRPILKRILRVAFQQDQSRDTRQRRQRLCLQVHAKQMPIATDEKTLIQNKWEMPLTSVANCSLQALILDV
jgi:hypothetical protein